MKEYKIKDIKDLAAHLKTMGAYVQQPNPQIVGLSNTQVVGSQDAKSLYPTIMVLLNIGYDTLRGRIYDYAIVGKVLEMFDTIFEMRGTSEQDIIEIGLNNFKSAFRNLARDYTTREKLKNSKAEFIEFTTDFYGECFRKIVNYQGALDDIYTPKTDEQYYLLKSALYPLLEAMTWIHQKNKGYSSIVIDHVFYNDGFNEKYQDKKFVIFNEINSSKTHVKILNLDQFHDQISSKYILNPYGTYFDKHDNNKSFEVDLILKGMSDRGYVKNQMLIIEAIVENWGKLSQAQQIAFVLDGQHLDPTIAEQVVDLVGDSDPGTKAWQLKNLKGIKFDTIVTEEKLNSRLGLAASQRNSKSNGIKVTLNSGYGIYGMATWNYGNNLIANSITSGGKIYGIKLFQQIASNKLRVERDKIKGQ
jgi:hypothetical protein